MRLRMHLWIGLLAPAAVLADGTAARACTSIMVGRLASVDGSVMTSHTCDSHRTGSAIVVRPRRRHPAGAMMQLTKRKEDGSGPMERYGRASAGKIPQAAETLGYLAPAYAAMNEHQLAIGESTFTGRKELQSKKGLIDCETLCQLMLERARTAREAIQLAGRLLAQHGWNDEGEALTLADAREVWLLEVIGPGKGKKGAVWAARRVPDDHVSVVANASRIGEIDSGRPDEYMASDNVREVATRAGYWDPKGGQPFRFNEAYNPDGRTAFSCTRREWRALSLLAPGLKLDPNRNEFPFSVRPAKKVSPLTIMEIFRDTFEGTEFDMVKNITVKEEKTNKVKKSPLANPFMPYEMNALFSINGGWGWRGERPMARWYCMYVTVTQSRAHLPDALGGVLWFGYDNPAMTTYVPLYAGITDLPENYKTDGRTTGFSRKSAWWAFNRVATLAAHRWGEMRKDVAAVRDPLQRRLLSQQAEVDKKAVKLLKSDPLEARRYLTGVSGRACEEVVRAYWDLGDRLWTRYDEKW